MNPRNAEECDEMLKILDFLRKSDCTPTHSIFKTGPSLQNELRCENALNKMRKITEECIEMKFKR